MNYNSHFLNPTRRREKEKQILKYVNNLHQLNIEGEREKYLHFAQKLDLFVEKYSDKILEDPEFRQNFHQMCTKIGVDPLTSTRGPWAKLQIGKSNTKLGIQLLTLCLNSRIKNGGVLDIQEIIYRLSKKDYELSLNIYSSLSNDSNIDIYNSQKANKIPPVTKNDIILAIQHLDPLGENILKIIEQDENTLIASLPSSMRPDQMICLQIAQKFGYIDYNMFNGSGDECNNAQNTVYSWPFQRFKDSIECFIRDKIVWVDDDPYTEFSKYWFPSIYLRIIHSKSEFKI